MIQTVKELIDELKKCNPDYPVRIYFNDDIKEIELVDNTLQDRVDINMLEENTDEKKKPTIDAVTLNLINKLKKIEDTINEGAWEYIHLGDIIRLQDASQEAISHFDLRKEGGIHDYGADKGKYQQFWHSDYVCWSDPNAFDPSKVEEEDDD